MSDVAVPEQPPTHPLRGRLCIAAAALLWSTSGLYAKSGFFEDWPDTTRGLSLAFWRATFAGLFVVLFVRRPTWSPKLLLASLAFPAMNFAYLSSMTLTTAANAIWLQNTAPLWIFISGRWIFHEPFDRRNLAPLVLGMLGAATIVGFELTSESLTRKVACGVALGLASGAFYATVVVSLRRFRADDTAWLVAVNQLMSALVLGPFVVMHGTMPHGMQWPVLIAFGVLQLGLPYLFFARGLRDVSAQEAAAIGLLEPVLVPVWVFFSPAHEVPAWWTMIGATLILVGLAVRYRR